MRLGLLTTLALLLPVALAHAQSLDRTEATAQTDPQMDVASAEIPDAPSAVQAAALKTDTAAAQTAVSPTPCINGVPQTAKLSAEGLKAEESQYIVAVVPNFNTVVGGCSPPLTAGQKMSLVYHATFVPFTIALDFILAGVDELDGDHKGYGWGPGGYFKRAGAEYLDTVDAAVIGNGLLPVVLRQDPRFFQLGPGHAVGKRIVHAAASDFICKGDNGKTQFNTSNILGNLIAGGISNAYYPADDRGLALTFENAAKVTLEGALASQLLEFSTDITEWWSRKKHHGGHVKAQPTTNSGNQASSKPGTQIQAETR